MSNRGMTEREKSEIRLERAERGLDICLWLIMIFGAIALVGTLAKVILGAAQ